MTEQITREQLEQVRFRCRKDLKFLCKVVLGYKDWSVNEQLHLDMARHLRKPSKFKLFLIPRDHLKSSVITKGGAILRLNDNPNIRILIANNTWDNARKFLGSISKYLAKGEHLSSFFGLYESRQWNQDEITIKQRTVILDAPTIATTGLEKEQTSQHYDLIIADDLVARENVGTPEQRAKVKDYINSLMALLEPEGELWVVGTRWSQDDAYGDLIEEGIWDVMQRSCWLDDAQTLPLFPEKFSAEKLRALRQKMGPYLFACWYLNNPVAQEAADFKREWIKTYDPTTPNPHRLILAVDPARSLAPSADFSAMTVSGMFPGNKIRLVDYVKKKLVPSGVVDEIFALHKKWKDRGHFVEVLIESYAFQQTLKYDVQRRQKETGQFFPVHEFKKFRGPNGEKQEIKNARIRALQPLFEQGLYEIRENMLDFIDELLAFPRGKRDDLIDSASMALEHLLPSAVTVKSDPKLDIFQDTETGKYKMTMNHWVKNYLPKPEGSIYERFMREVG